MRIAGTLLAAAGALLLATAGAQAGGLTATSVGGAPYAITTAGGELWFSDLGQGDLGHLAPGAEPVIIDLRLNGVSDVAAGPDGNVWVTERGYIPGPAARVARIAPNGTVTEFDIEGVPQALAAGPDGNIWVAAGSRIVKVTPAGVPTSYPLPNGIARDIAPGPDGALWYAGAQGDRSGLGRISTDGQLSFLPGPKGTVYSVTSGPDGTLWAGATGEVQRVTVDGASSVFDVPGETPIGSITSGPDGNLWFTDESGDRLGRVTPTGLLTSLPLPIPAAQPHAITAGPDGALWFTEPGTGRLGRAAVDATPDEPRPLLALKVRRRPFRARGAIRFSFQVPPVLPQPIPLQPDEDPAGAPDGGAYLMLRIKHVGKAPRGCVRNQQYQVVGRAPPFADIVQRLLIVRGIDRPGATVRLTALPPGRRKARRSWCAGRFRAGLRLEYFTSPGPGSGPDVLARSKPVRGRVARGWPR